jgi:ATP-dependent Clp protease ATP-binding subunit ClpC
MFERYTEPARRVIFFARYATSERGAECIETEHLILGLLREDESLVRRFLAPGDSIEAVRKDIEKETARSEKKIPTSLDLPLSNESKPVLAYAAEESQNLSEWNIGTIHLLLGFFGVEHCLAAKILLQHNIEPSVIRRGLHREKPPAGFVPDAETAQRIAEAVCIPIFGQSEVEKEISGRVGTQRMGREGLA